MTLLRRPALRSLDHGTAFASTLSGLAIDCNWQVAGRPIAKADRPIAGLAVPEDAVVSIHDRCKTLFEGLLALLRRPRTGSQNNPPGILEDDDGAAAVPLGPRLHLVIVLGIVFIRQWAILRMLRQLKEQQAEFERLLRSHDPHQGER